ncbi:MAG: biopolymer transporter ExbD [Nitrospinae bacterium]|nr:biopolymer transporter ExbD [Nitrospinota bacterium]MZH40346.1 biopolymer transporter ExbD [Nitrospinota bacterium]MZH47315.1 biopolymer transporter ExbD [Nitrospinota bacterium]
MIKLPYKDKKPFKLDMIPMINVVFLLLIFFMLTATTPTKDSRKIELPEAKTAEKSNKQYLTMTIDRNGDVLLDGIAVTLDSLPGLLEQKVNSDKKTVIGIHADKEIEFDVFGQVIAIAKQSGAEDFMLATEQAETDS